MIQARHGVGPYRRFRQSPPAFGTTYEKIERLVEAHLFITETIPEFEGDLPVIRHDRKDDYLFAHAVVGQAAFLVSGDTGVQEIGQIGTVQVVSPAELVEILQAADPR